MLDAIVPFLTAETGLPLASSLLTGVLIGIEREMQGKPAGLRTHTLVCFASTLLTLAAAQQVHWGIDLAPSTQIVSDPTRMAHGILTGIGFLGAGVIFREGASVHGLTTAASLWVTAALGIVFGVGMYGLAVLGAVVTLSVLVGLRLAHPILPRSSGVRLKIEARASSGMDAAAVRRLLKSYGLHDHPLSQSYDRQTGVLEFTTSTWSRRMPECDRLAEALRADPAVLRFSMRLTDDDGARELPR